MGEGETLSVAPPFPTNDKGYIFPEEKTTMFDSLNLSAILPGKNVFIIQVYGSLPDVPNL